MTKIGAMGQIRLGKIAPEFYRERLEFNLGPLSPISPKSHGWITRKRIAASAEGSP